MKITFDAWAADELIQAYLDFVRKKQAKTVHMSYSCDKHGYRETREGTLETGDKRLTEMPRRVQYTQARQHLELSQAHWQVPLTLTIATDGDWQSAELSFDKTLHRELYQKFRSFEPRGIS